MPRKKKRKKEISISSPPKRRKEKLLEDTTEVERLAVFKVSGRIGRFLSGLTIGVGVLLFFFSLNYLVFDNVLGFLDIEIFFSSDQMKNLTIGLLGFFGVLNTLCGLLLLTKE